MATRLYRHTASEDQVVARLQAIRIVPVASVHAHQMDSLCKALISAGLPCLEIVFRNEDAVDAIKAARSHTGLLVGAGTIRSTAQAVAAAEAGAHFAVAPAMNEEVMACCRELGLPFFPGVATPTEVDRVRALGGHTVKVFPARQLGGAEFVRALSTVYPDVRFIPTGGVRAADLPAYFALESVLACGGSWFFEDMTELESRAREAVELAAP